MSKTQKTCSARKCNKVKQPALSEELNKKFFESLRNKRPSAEDIEREEEYQKSLWEPSFSENAEHDTSEDTYEENEEDAEYTNVEIMVGASIEDTHIFVDGRQLKGCIKANLEFDTEFGVPTLTLTVIGPTVGAPLRGSLRLK